MEKHSQTRLRPHKKTVPYYLEGLGELFPQQLNFYDTVELYKHTHHPADLGQQQLQTYFDYCYSVVFTLQGELCGQAIAQITEENLEGFPDSLEEFYAFFIEMGNTLLGHFLTALDKKKNILAQLNAPFVFSSQRRTSSNEGIRKSRVLALIGQLMGPVPMEKIEFSMTYKDRTYPFHIILITQALRVAHD